MTEPCTCPACGAPWPFTVDPDVFLLTLLAFRNDRLQWRELEGVLELWEPAVLLGPWRAE